MSLSKGFRVYQKLEPRFSVILESRAKDEALIFESNAVAVLSAAEAETLKKSYIKVLDPYGCLGVLNLTTADEPILYLVLVSACIAIGKIGDSDIYRITGTTFQPLHAPAPDEEGLAELRKLLNGGSFYFSWPLKDAKFCLSICAQRFFSKQSVDNRFFWNRNLHLYLWRFGIDCSVWLLKIICGGVEIRTIYAAQKQAKACLISRYSCERAGTRFNVRGVNDEGHVANFVETEQLIWIEDEVCSFVQTRGSVPLFWEQPGFQVGSPKVKMHRGHEASAPAFDRHFTLQKVLYGGQVIVNLLGKNEGEHMLNQAFQSHHKASACCQDIPFVSFDYHSENRNAKNLSAVQENIRKHTDDFGFFYGSGSDIKKTQTGTIRTNCFDCLDRTNAMQSILGLEMLLEQLNCLGLSVKAQMKARFEEVYKQMWNVNADHVSRIYAGTAALGKSKATDAARSAGRAIQNNFLDSAKQDAIDMLLFGSGMKTELSYKTTVLLDTPCLPGSREIMRSMISKSAEFASTSNIRVSVGTWNVNGGKFFRSVAFKHELITDWLLDMPKLTKPTMVEPDVDFNVPVDIFAIGFQEIVDLNASNIVRASTQNQKEWGIYLQKNLSREHKYIQLTSAQLVGVCLYIFVRPRHAPHIKDMSVVTIKTGLGGATGNKGAIGVRFNFYNTSFCFVCSHFAAGQTNVKERNNQYHDILQKISFPMGRKLWHHDYIFWFGDFNYRMDLAHEEVKDLIQMEKWGEMQMGDQLNAQREAELVFQGFEEGPTNFAPTYKYDLFCEDYDTSDKCRVPAWTDRVLWRRNAIAGTRDSDNPFADTTDDEKDNNGRLLLYNRAELKSSDHRPVMAIFELEVLRCDVSKRNSTFRQVIDRLGPPDGTVQVELIPTQVQFSDGIVEEIINVFGEIGDISLVRFQGSCMLVTFSSGREALEALKMKERLIDGQTINVSLRNPHWHQLLEEELNLTGGSECMIPSVDSTRNSLLDDDITIPVMAFEGSADEEAEDEDSCEDGITQSPATKRKSSAPQVVKMDSADAVFEEANVYRPVRPELPPNGDSFHPSSRRSSEGQSVHSTASGSVAPLPVGVSSSFTVGSDTNLSEGHIGQDGVNAGKAEDVSEVRNGELDINIDQKQLVERQNSDGLSADPAMAQITNTSAHQKRPTRTCPPRPAALPSLPSRPPPPSRPKVPPAMTKTSSIVSESPEIVEKSTNVQTQPTDIVPARKQNLPVVSRQPMRPQMGQRHERPTQVKMINHISTPTNVSHTVHATTIEEAQQLIRRLMHGNASSTSAASSTGEKRETTPVVARRRQPQDSTNRGPIPRAKSEYQLSSGEEPRPHALQRNRSIGSGDTRSTRPSVPAPPPPRSSGAPTPISAPRSCPPTPAPRREVKAKDPEVQEMNLRMSAPERTRRGSSTSTEKSSTKDGLEKLAIRRSSSDSETSVVMAPHRGELRTAPKMASPRPHPPPVPLSGPDKATMSFGASGATPQE